MRGLRCRLTQPVNGGRVGRRSRAGRALPSAISMLQSFVRWAKRRAKLVGHRAEARFLPLALPF